MGKFRGRYEQKRGRERSHEERENLLSSLRKNPIKFRPRVVQF